MNTEVFTEQGKLIKKVIDELELMGQIVKLIKQIDPNNIDDGLELNSALRSHFKLVGNTWSRKDASTRACKTLTDDEWEAMYNTSWWNSLGVESEVDLYCIDEAIKQSGIDYDLNI